MSNVSAGPVNTGPVTIEPTTLFVPPTEDRVLLMQQAATRLWRGTESFWHPGGLGWQARTICGPDSVVAVFGSIDALTGWGWSTAVI